MIKIPPSSYDADDPRSYLKAVAELRLKLLNESCDLEKDLDEYKCKLDEERKNVREILQSNYFVSENLVDNFGEFSSENNDQESGAELINCLKDVQKSANILSYLLCLKRVEKINEDLEINLRNLHSPEAKNSNFISISIVYEELREISKSLKASKCNSLENYVKTTKKCWKTFLIKRLNQLVNEIFQEFEIPTKELTKNLDQAKARLSDLAFFAFSINSNFDGFVEAILTPFRLRFVYHFTDPNSKIVNKLIGGEMPKSSSSSQSSNLSSSKPEWYLSLILKWYRNFLPTLTDINFDLFGRSENISKYKRQIVEDFGRGLVILARERLKYDLNFVADNEKLLPHLIDEAIAFDIELRGLNYPENEVGCIELLTEPVIFEAWLDLEHQQCTKCVENLLADASAWHLRYSEASDLDVYKVPRCTDSFLSLLTAMTRRYRLLRSRQHRVQFVHLQRALLDDFRMHLFQLTRSSPTPWTTPFPQIANAVAYTKCVLSQWQESPFFVDLETGAFDELIDLFEHFRRQMLSDAREAAAEEMKPLLTKYKNEFSSAFRHDTRDTVVNTSGNFFADNCIASILTPLQARLMEIRDLLSTGNFRDFLRLFADSLEALIIDRVVMEIRADAKIGEELKHQLAGLLPKLFRVYGLSLDGSIYFQKLSQCLSLYELNVAGCVLLRETLKNEKHNDSSSVENVALDMGLSLLNVKEIEALLQRRSDITFV